MARASAGERFAFAVCETHSLSFENRFCGERLKDYVFTNNVGLLRDLVIGLGRVGFPGVKSEVGVCVPGRSDW